MFSRTFAFVALGRARFNGSSERRYRSDYRCQLRYQGRDASELEEVRVYFVSNETVNCDEEVAVLVAFLRWDHQQERCKTGVGFELREGDTTTATGLVELLAVR